MGSRTWVRFLVVLGLMLPVGALSGVATATASGSGSSVQRYIVVVRSGAGYSAVRSLAVRGGAQVLADLPGIRAIVIKASSSARDAVAADSRTLQVVADHVETIAQPEQRLVKPGTLRPRTVLISGPARSAAPVATVQPDPSFHSPGLVWDFRRENVIRAWKTTIGDPGITVGVADTGLDYTHTDLASQVVSVVDFTAADRVPLCKTYFGASDKDLAAQFGGPETTDWNGHGSWIGGHIAGALNGVGMNGAAPGVKLVALKISQWCGSAYDSDLIRSFYYAANHGINIVNISFGGYLDRSTTTGDRIYMLYESVVNYAKAKGTTIVAAAGNEHTQIGAGGLVLSHGSLTTPGGTFTDYFGQYEVPGGVPGVVDVSSTGRTVNASSPTCAPGTFESSLATCKPATDAHQATGVGTHDQLAYYSNYGPRIDLAGPGGARKFNLPSADRGGTPGWPYTTEAGRNDWEDFSVTSNWAQQIPCFFIAGGGFPAGQCYTAIQGTSMAAPQVAGVLALLLSAHPELIGDVDGAVAALKAGATAASNATTALSPTDVSPGDLTGLACPTGYCHLGGSPISNADAYGAGIVNAANVV